MRPETVFCVNNNNNKKNLQELIIVKGGGNVLNSEVLTS